MDEKWADIQDKVYGWFCTIDSTYQSSLELLKINPFTQLTLDSSLHLIQRFLQA